MPSQIHIFPGLGADERVFQRLDFYGHDVTFVKWIRPEKNETIEGYAFRISKQIHDSKPILIGLSFGGMVALEVAKLIETEKVILISSAKNKNEIPVYYRIAGWLGVHKLLSTRMIKSSNRITNWLFGAQNSFEKKLLRQILIETDPFFLKWAIDKIVRWKNESIPNNLFHIHGTKDKILPIRFIECQGVVEKGGHLMVLSKSEEVNILIKKQLDTII